MTKTIVITGAGAGGSNNLIESLRLSNLDMDRFHLIGTNIDPKILAKSPLEENYILPVATSDEYPDAMKRLIRERNVDLVIPNNDREVGRISELRDELGCRVFLPDKEAIRICHDKQLFYERLAPNDIPMARSIALKSLDDIPAAMADLGGDKFWVRPRTGSGSRGATWVAGAEQAQWWIRLWVEQRGYKVDQFTVSPFLPGRDYCFQSVWKDGELVLCKMCERLEYFFGANKLSGMSSTPAVARTLRDEEALKTLFKTVRLLSDRPHGNFSFDMKGRADGTMCVCECNIGRFCMITPIFDRTGAHSTAEMHVRCAFDDDSVAIDEPIDIAEDFYLLRELDTLPTIVHKRELDRLAGCTI